MKINYIKVEKDFMYLWLKTVENVDLTKHCAKCLIGEYDKRINNTIKEKKEIVLDPNKVYYLCGVSKPFVWRNNFHLAFKNKIGSTIKYINNGIEIVIEDAEQLPINFDYIDKNNIFANNKAYCTCRNWQFANYFKNFIKNE